MKQFFTDETIPNKKKFRFIIYSLIIILTPVTIWLSESKWTTFILGIVFIVIGDEIVKILSLWGKEDKDEKN